MKLLVWLTAAHLAQAAGRHGQRSMRKRQAVEEAPAPKFEGLRLSYITETTTQKVTETQTVAQTDTGDATASVQTMTVTVNAAAVTVTVNAPPVTVTEVVNEVVTQIATQYITQIDTQIVTQVAPAPPAVTVTETITETIAQPITIVDVSPITIVNAVTEQVTVTGPAPPAITFTHTVQAPQDKPLAQKMHQGVVTVPIDQDALPTTTFGADPLFQSLVEKPTTIKTTAPSPSYVASPGQSEATPDESEATPDESEATPDESEAIPSEDETAPSEDEAPVDFAPSMELGNMEPDATPDLDSPALDAPEETAAPEPSSNFGAPIDLSDMKLSSVLDLGNLAGGSGPLKARATDTA
ncbi:hypothetical protein F66182_5847 [Fusarium sp. NRRL 66182]|nr:hypothetical protein F66182_5847 [Fusarium sp. NRRL 66182]